MYYPSKYGGVEKWLCSLVEEGMAHGHRTHIAYTQSIGDVGSYQERITASNGQLIILEDANRILAHCRDNAIDVVHFHFDFPEPVRLYRELHRMGCMIFQHFHCECSYHVHRQWQHHPVQFARITYHRAKIRLSSHYFTAFLGCSQAVTAQYQKFYFLPKQKTRTLYLGIPRCPTSPKTVAPSAVPTIVCTAFHSPVKGVDVLLDALSILKKEKIPFRLMQIGGGSSELNGEDTKELHDRCHQSGLDDEVIWVGVTNHVDRYLCQADIYCQPSRTEALSLSIIEAMQYSLPVVASNVGGVSELVSDGINGFLVAPDSPRLLAQKLRILLTDPELRRSMGQRSSSLLEDLGFFQDISAKQVMEIYQQIIHPTSL